jgi:hypothetical protein
MEQFKKFSPIIGAVLTTVAAVLVAGRQIGGSQILVAIISTIIAAATLGVVFYLQFQDRHHQRDDDPDGRG